MQRRSLRSHFLLGLVAAGCGSPAANESAARLALTSSTRLPVVADTTLRQRPTNTNWGTDVEIKVGYGNGNTRNSRTLVRVDDGALRAALGGKTLVSAALEVQIHDSSTWPGGTTVFAPATLARAAMRRSRS